MLRQLDTADLRRTYQQAQPFPSICIDNFLDPAFALEVARSYPPFHEAEALGKSFNAVNERRKVQITDPDKFPEPVKRLSDLCASEQFRRTISEVTGIGDLLWDGGFAGGGMHQTAAHGRLDVHVDFNRLSGSGWYRRVNLLLYLNERWDETWGGDLELWDRGVKRCQQVISPSFNRCVIFTTSEISFHGVTALKCPPNVVRKSFALYYYTEAAPADAGIAEHSTIFRARPDEHLKRYVLMPAERLQQAVLSAKSLLKSRAKEALRRSRS